MVGHRSTRPALAVLALLTGGVALSGAGCSSGGGSSDATGPTTTFLVETDEGTQAFGRDDEAGSFSFEGDDGIPVRCLDSRSATWIYCVCSSR
jgi:hypothetical protein